MKKSKVWSIVTMMFAVIFLIAEMLTESLFLCGIFFGLLLVFAMASNIFISLS